MDGTFIVYSDKNGTNSDDDSYSVPVGGDNTINEAFLD